MAHKINIQIVLEVEASCFDIECVEIASDLARLISRNASLFVVTDLLDDSKVFPNRVTVEVYECKAVLETIHGHLQLVEESANDNAE